MWYGHSHVRLGFHQVNYPKADLWLQKEFVGCNLPVPITVKTYSGGSSERVGAGSRPAPIRPAVVFYYLFDPESVACIGSHITIQLVDFSLQRGTFWHHEISGIFEKYVILGGYSQMICCLLYTSDAADE